MSVLLTIDAIFYMRRTVILWSYDVIKLFEINFKQSNFFFVTAQFTSVRTPVIFYSNICLCYSPIYFCYSPFISVTAQWPPQWWRVGRGKRRRRGRGCTPSAGTICSTLREVSWRRAGRPACTSSVRGSGSTATGAATGRVSHEVQLHSSIFCFLKLSLLVRTDYIVRLVLLGFRILSAWFYFAVISLWTSELYSWKPSRKQQYLVGRRGEEEEEEGRFSSPSSPNNSQALITHKVG